MWLSSLISCLFLLVACSTNAIHSRTTKASLCAGDRAIRGTDFNNNETDMHKLPVDFNDKVKKWIRHFQSKGRQSMYRYLSRSSKYLPKMKQILRSHGLPEDLVYIALIESGFLSNAHSRAHAVGYWQFIRNTGRRYGLKQNYYLDERRDFIHSTEAAARYLKALYNLFGSWYLAIASYNVGENRIKNLVMKHSTRDFWLLARIRRLPWETRNYIPKFLAARLIARHPAKYGFGDVIYEPPLDFKEITVKNQGVSLGQLAKNLKISRKELHALNPAYKRGIVPKKRENKLRLPTHIDDKIILAALGKSSSLLTANAISNTDGKIYRIRRGDTLGYIARRFGVSLRTIREANNLSRRAVLYPGKKLVIPMGRKVAWIKKSKIKGNKRKTSSSSRFKIHVVRKGESLFAIARHYKTSIAALARANRMNHRAHLIIGRELVIP